MQIDRAGPQQVPVFLLDAAGALRAQHDGFPAGGDRPTSAWTPGEIVFDAHSIRLPADLPPGEYTVIVGLYDWQAGANLAATGSNVQPGHIVDIGRLRLP
mgnify:CR=1 FL=1